MWYPLVVALGVVSASVPARADFFGGAVVTVGDVDGDGVSDFAVADPLNQAGGLGFGAGRVWVVSARTGRTLLSLTGEANGDYFGAAMAAPGDLDADGVPDLIVGAPCPGHQGIEQEDATDDALEEDVGYVVAISLGTGERIYKVATPRGGYMWWWRGAYALPPLLTLDDLTADGVADFAIGMPFGDSKTHKHSGVVRTYCGRSGKLLHERFGDGSHSHLGTRLALIGDLDGDALPDLLVGGGNAECSELSLGDAAGYVQVCSSADLSMLFRVTPEHPSPAFGLSLCGLGDTSGDGEADFAVGQPRVGMDGPVRRYSGADGSLLGSWKDRGPAFGTELISLGDLNRDGVNELGVSAAAYEKTKTQRLLFVMSGADDAILGEVRADVPIFLYPGIALSVLDRAESGRVKELLVGAATLRGASNHEGQVYTVDIEALEVNSSLGLADLRR